MAICYLRVSTRMQEDSELGLDAGSANALVVTRLDRLTSRVHAPEPPYR
ncbi:hypothetical protein [Candidatus Spongiisocius sp.]